MRSLVGVGIGPRRCRAPLPSPIPSKLPPSLRSSTVLPKYAFAYLLYEHYVPQRYTVQGITGVLQTLE
jgi:hypothetical protein